MNNVVIEKNLNNILLEIKKNTPIIIFKKFLKKNICKKIVALCHKNFSFKDNRKKKFNKYFNFISLDVLPSKVMTNRIFRTIELSDFLINKIKPIKALIDFQNKLIKLKKNKKIYRKVQIIHYPRGGGFFGEHSHPRYPTNYGIIVTLSEKNKDFKKGITNFRLGKKNINLEKYDVTVGDLILFRFDLPHFVSPCDPEKNLIFDNKGRWTMVLPVSYEKF